MGSPPLARGTEVIPTALANQIRITPACAGNSTTNAQIAFVLKDHPRLRGEQYMCSLLFLLRRGSPPLARGTDDKARATSPKGGITPACAGNRQDSHAPDKLCKDHPRLRGEQTSCASRSVPSAGSPPLARGTAFAVKRHISF